MREIVISKNEEGQRFDKFLSKYLNKAPKSFIYKMLRKKNITLNKKKDDGSTILKLNDTVNIFICEDSIVNFIEEKEQPAIIGNRVELNIVYEDKDIIVINKPVGLLSQKAEKKDISANEYIIDYLLSSEQLTKTEMKTFTPSICNRLDRNTSGLLVAGKSLSGLQNMSKVFRERSLHKYYLCIVNGVVKQSKLIKGYLKKDEKSNKVIISKTSIEGAQAIETEYVPIADNGHITLMMINLITGKPHQIRAHLSYIGHPIIGDYKYGNSKLNDTYKKLYKINSQLLHAYKLELDDKRILYAKLPSVFENMLVDEKITTLTWREGSGYLEFKRS